VVLFWVYLGRSKFAVGRRADVGCERFVVGSISPGNLRRRGEFVLLESRVEKLNDFVGFRLILELCGDKADGRNIDPVWVTDPEGRLILSNGGMPDVG
jgi:hypothetical protein